MEFSDLNEDIEAEDWLIPSGEITRRRLIKQTPRFNVYKADWFGDVLVYEPANNRPQLPQSRFITQFDARQQQRDFFRSSRLFNQEELSSRLGELGLSESKLHKSQLSLNSDISADIHDSAYSSISSTPQYHTKDLTCGFEFPSNGQLASSSLDSLSNFADGMIRIDKNVELDSSNVTYSNSSETNKPTSPVTVLNKDSYTFGVHIKGTQTFFGDNGCNKCKPERTTWNELNDLRLVAHEGFMLFMGASLDDASESTSLVMQMNHPKAVSLYNLLHASKIVSTTTTTANNSNDHFLHSPIDRFFASKQQQRPKLCIEAKLKICQQVTDAMTYLHDKNIVHGKLTSVNIYLKLNQQVKISLIDENPAAIASTSTDTTTGGHNHNSVEFNLPALTYLSPELIKTIGVVSAKSNRDNEQQQAHVHMDTSLLTKKSDIFSFGTLLFELFEERFPFTEVQDQTFASARSSSFNSPRLSNTPTSGNSPLDSPFDSRMSSTNWNGNIKASASEIIYQIGAGQTEVNNLNKYKNRCSTLVEHIISACWSTSPSMRPHFKQLSFA